MTKQEQYFIPCPKCRHGISRRTAFSNWTPIQKELDSMLGYRFTDIDCIWFREAGKYHNELTKYMMLETKIFNGFPSPNQLRIQIHMDVALRNDTHYYGYHLIQFENTSPDDGKIFIDKKEINKENFIKFLKFELNKEFYISFYKK